MGTKDPDTDDGPDNNYYNSLQGPSRTKDDECPACGEPVNDPSDTYLYVSCPECGEIL